MKPSPRTTSAGGAAQISDTQLPPDTRTPRDELMDKQEPPEESERDMILRVETLRGFFAYCLAGVSKDPTRILGRFMAAAYTTCPDLIDGATQREIADLIGIDKSTFNYLVMNRFTKLGLRARVQKSDEGRRKLSEAKRNPADPIA
jgi:hypothetical protein